MNYQVNVTSEVQQVLKKWKKSNPQLLKKFQKIFHELAEHPTTGTGHPEPLKGGQGITYSRRLSASDRIIYDIYENIITVLVIKVESHYNDK
jgi:toxin YoeB